MKANEIRFPSAARSCSSRTLTGIITLSGAGRLRWASASWRIAPATAARHTSFSVTPAERFTAKTRSIGVR
jgi:hypothetical protein